MTTEEQSIDKKSEKFSLNIFDILIVLAKRKRLIIIVTLTAAVVAAIYSFTLPNLYSAQTKILPPLWKPVEMDFMGKSGTFSLLKSLFEKNDFYSGVLRSNAVFDRIIDRFNLIEDDKYNDMLTRRMIRGELNSSISLLPYDEGIGLTRLKPSSFITIIVRNRDHELAADLANALVEELGKALQELAVTEASQRRLFFEKQLTQSKEALIKAEEAMVEFQKETGLLRADSQAEAAMQRINSLKNQISSKEVELVVLRTYNTPNNPDLQKIEETLKGLQIELEKLGKNDKNNPNSDLTIGTIPSIGTEYVRKMRNLTFNESLYESMLKQYELAKIEESKDAPFIQVIEKALPIKKRIQPKRRKMVQKAALLGLFISVAIAFMLEFFERKHIYISENQEKINTLKKLLSFKKIK